jgi:putative addiction module component (TIGR02574 family)
MGETGMAPSLQSLGIDRLNARDRLELAKSICDSIDPSDPTAEFREFWREEIMRRLAECEANPDDVVPFDLVEAEALARLGS